MSNIKDVFKNFSNSQELGERVDKIVKWRSEAKTVEEIKQADEALEILTQDIPAILKALEPSKKDQIISAIKFGLEVAKIFVRS